MFNKLRLVTYLIIFTIVCFTSCSKKATTASSGNDFKSELHLAMDSMNVIWSSMDASEIDKIQSINRLLDELSYINGSDPNRIDSLKSLAKVVKTAMLKADNMTSTSIDDYDSITDKLIRGTLSLRAVTPSTEEHPIIERLESSIMSSDGNLIVFRYKYDRWAIKYNELVQNNKGRLTKMGAPYSEFKARPLFQIQP